jgi:ABC-type ATPase with predicted acetyltransferase domain
MPNDDNNKVVKLRQPQVQTPAAGVSVDEAITPKSFLNMTDVEQDLFLQQLRERRMRVVEVLRQAAAARAHATTVASAVRLEKKADSVQRLLDRATKSLDKLEEAVYGLRALTLQQTDVDITKPQKE